MCEQRSSVHGKTLTSVGTVSHNVSRWNKNVWTLSQVWEKPWSIKGQCEHKVKDVLRRANDAMMACNGMLKWQWGSEGEVRKITWQGMLGPMEDAVNCEGEQVNKRLDRRQRQGEVEGEIAVKRGE